jgi:hypothetical protein
MVAFLSALPRRQLALGVVALMLFILLVARWIGDWGLVTIHAKDEPLSKVISSIARQGGVRIESALDPTKLVTMDVVKVPPVEALETLAGIAEAGWSIVYLAAPTKNAINEAVLALNGTGKIENWVVSYYPSPASGSDNGQVIDPGTLSITLEGGDPDLGKLLDEAAQKSGVMTALPKDWIVSAKLPKPTSVRNAISSMVGSVHGKVSEFFFLTERPRRVWGGGPGEGDGGPEAPRPSIAGVPSGGLPPPSGVSPADSLRGSIPNPEWIQQRQRARIKKLPKAEQEQAKKDMEERRAFFDSLKGLSPAERAAKFQDMMANSELGQKMQDSRLIQDAKQSAARRITRAVNYLNRKAAAKAPAK